MMKRINKLSVPARPKLAKAKMAVPARKASVTPKAPKGPSFLKRAANKVGSVLAKREAASKGYKRVGNQLYK